MGIIPTRELAEIGPWGLVTIIVLLIAFGLLIPRWIHVQRVNDLKEARDQAEARSQEWRQIALQLMGTGEVAVKALEAIKEEATK